MKLSVLFILVSFFMISCSSSEESTKRDTKRYDEVKKFRNEVNLELGENVSWINLMPGTSPKFHVSGKLTLLDGGNYDIKNTELKYIKIYQGSEEIYYIMPKVIKTSNPDFNNFTYSTIKGLSINDKLNRKKPVIFELIFVDGENELRYRTSKIKIEEVQ